MRRAPVDVTLIDRRNFHLFQPLLYQVATGALSPGDICAPIRGVLSSQKNTEVLLGEAADIDPQAQRVTLKDGGVYDYDALIVSTGSKTSYYGKDKWRGYAPSLKTIEEATAIRHKILFAFEAAERAATHEERLAWLTFVVVGAGATGVELSGAVGEIARHTLKHDFRHIRPEESRIFLIDGSSHVLPSYTEDLARDAERALRHLGVKVQAGVKVTDIDANGVTYQGEGKPPERIVTKTVLWAGGVTVTSFGETLARRTGATTDRHGRIRVNPDLTVPNFPNIYVLGDLAAFLDKDGKQLPGVAQVAMQGGAYAAKAIVARLNGPKELAPFSYLNKGDLAVIGRGSAVANIFGAHLSGWPAWLVWLFIHLMYLVQFENRLIVFTQWGIQFLTWGRGAMLITGHNPTEE